MIEAVDLLRVGIERAAHHEPHHEFDALGPGLAHQFEMRDPGQRFGVGRELVEEASVRIPC